MTTVVSNFCDNFGGEATLPGDKSISIRALIFGALAEGVTTITGLPESEDVQSTLQALRALGVDIQQSGQTTTIAGVGQTGFQSPARPIDFGNSGTGSRLMLGALAGFDVTATITGDASLQKRPFQRVTHPLAQMGAQFSGSSLPITLMGSGHLEPLQYKNDLSSAQVKSAILLAGLRAKGRTLVHEAIPSRDHTESMLRTFGVPVSPPPTIAIEGPATLKATDISIPGDISAAAFLLVAGMVSGTKGLILKQVGINPGRAAYLKVLKAMGAEISFSNRKNDSGEDTADIFLKSGPLAGIETSPKDAPALIDEFPILFVAAALAKTESKFCGLSELRQKESDRLALMAEGLKANGVDARIAGDDLYIHPGLVKGGAVIDPEMDHRIAMAFLVLGMASWDPITVKGAETISTSFPGFAKVMNGLGANLKDTV